MKVYSFVWEFIKVFFIPILLIISFISLMYITEMESIIIHEDIHSKIYEAYGVPSNVSIDYYSMSGKTIISSKDYQEKCAGTPCQTLQEQNEIVSYNASMLATMLYGSVLILLTISIIIYMQFKELNNINYEILKVLTEVKNG